MPNDSSQPSSSEQRLRMVNGQLRTSDVTDTALLAAFLDTPREKFVAPAFARLAYLDRDLPSAGDTTRRLLAPRTLALLLQAAAIGAGDRILDVGGGSGYGAALLAHMGAKVIALESAAAATAARAALAGLESVEVVEGDLAAGVPSRAPFDVIVVNGAVETTPNLLLRQLADRGRLVGVDVRGGTSRGVVIERSAGGFGERSLFDARAETLAAFARAPSFAF